MEGLNALAGGLLAEGPRMAPLEASRGRPPPTRPPCGNLGRTAPPISLCRLQVTPPASRASVSSRGRLGQ